MQEKAIAHGGSVVGVMHSNDLRPSEAGKRDTTYHTLSSLETYGDVGDHVVETEHTVTAERWCRTVLFVYGRLLQHMPYFLSVAGRARLSH